MLQYTNLKFQAMSLGLGEEWDRICRAYAAANRALGDIVKVSEGRHRNEAESQHHRVKNICMTLSSR